MPSIANSNLPFPISRNEGNFPVSLSRLNKSPQKRNTSAAANSGRLFIAFDIDIVT